MAIDLTSLRRTSKDDLKPPIIVLYAEHGLGKTTFAAHAPDPVFLQTEEGQGILEINTFGLLRSYEDVMDGIQSLYSGEHAFKTVVLDSAGWLEPLIWEKVKLENQWTDEKFADYGRGYAAALHYWKNVFDGISLLRNDRGMGAIILTHTDMRKIEPPDMDSYTQYQPKLHRTAMAKLSEYAEGVFFMAPRVSVVKEDEKDKNSRKMGRGTDKRVVYTAARPPWKAKNRWGMPLSIDMPSDPTQMFSTVAKHIPYYANMMSNNAVNALNTAAQ